MPRRAATVEADPGSSSASRMRWRIGAASSAASLGSVTTCMEAVTGATVSLDKKVCQIDPKAPSNDGPRRKGALRAAELPDILNRMVQYSRTRLDASFAALSDATRRGVLEQLGRCDASITDLADRFHMTLTGMKKHVGVLEQAGLVTTEKIGRVRTCTLGSGRLE